MAENKEALRLEGFNLSGDSITAHQINPSTLNIFKVLHPPQLAPTDPQTTDNGPVTAIAAPVPCLGNLPAVLRLVCCGRIARGEV